MRTPHKYVVRYVWPDGKRLRKRKRSSKHVSAVHAPMGLYGLGDGQGPSSRHSNPWARFHMLHTGVPASRCH